MRKLRREFEMIGAFERFSLLFLAGAVVLAVGAAAFVRMPVTSPAPVPLSASDQSRSENTATTSAATEDVAEPAEYDLEAVAAGTPVPRVFAASPPDRREIARRKAPDEESLRTLLPLVLLVNENILADRKQLWSIRHNLDLGERLSPEQRIWLDLVAGRYALPGADLDELARRIDVIPPSIALAAVGTIQAMTRVGRAAKAAAAQRALIGQVLGEAPPRLDSPLDALRAYTRAVNAASAYRDFRKERERLRRAGEPLDGLRLAAFLPKLQPGNPLGAQELSGMIGAHRLTRFDRARLEPSGSAS